MAAMVDKNQDISFLQVETEFELSSVLDISDCVMLFAELWRTCRTSYARLRTR